MPGIGILASYQRQRPKTCPVLTWTAPDQSELQVDCKRFEANRTLCRGQRLLRIAFTFGACSTRVPGPCKVRRQGQRPREGNLCGLPIPTCTGNAGKTCPGFGLIGLQARCLGVGNTGLRKISASLRQRASKERCIGQRFHIRAAHDASMHLTVDAAPRAASRDESDAQAPHTL